MKTTRNAFYKSGSPYSSRYMWNNGLDILWSHFSHFYFQDLDMRLHLLPKITCDHVVLNSYSKMNVRFSNGVLSHTVSSAVRAYGPPEFSETAQFCGIMASFSDCTIVRNLTEHQKKRKPFLAPYTSVDDNRFQRITKVFFNTLIIGKYLLQIVKDRHTKVCKSMFVTNRSCKILVDYWWL